MALPAKRERRGFGGSSGRGSGRRKNILDIKVYGKDIEKALKALKRQLQREALFKEIKKRSFYEKPSEKKKRKQREARKKRMKALRFKKPVNNQSRPKNAG